MNLRERKTNLDTPYKIHIDFILIEDILIIFQKILVSRDLFPQFDLIRN